MNPLLTGANPPLEPDQPLPESIIPLALNRIGASHLPIRLGRVNVFRWFVELSQLDLNKLSPADFLAKREEYGALQRHLWNSPSPYMPPPYDLERLKSDASRHLIEFVDRGGTQLHPRRGHLFRAGARQALRGLNKRRDGPSGCFGKWESCFVNSGRLF